MSTASAKLFNTPMVQTTKTKHYNTVDLNETEVLVTEDGTILGVASKDEIANASHQIDFVKAMKQYQGDIVWVN